MPHLFTTHIQLDSILSIGGVLDLFVENPLNTLLYFDSSPEACGRLTSSTFSEPVAEFGEPKLGNLVLLSGYIYSSFGLEGPIADGSIKVYVVPVLTVINGALRLDHYRLVRNPPYRNALPIVIQK